MKYAHILFSFLIISLSCMLWDFNNVGTLSIVIKSELLCRSVMIVICVLGFWKGFKLLSNCSIHKMFITFLILLAVMAVIIMLLFRFQEMKKDIAVVLIPLYVVLPVLIFIPVKNNPEKAWSYKYLIPEVFALIIATVYFCFRDSFSVGLDFLCVLSIYAIGFFYTGCILLLFICNMIKRTQCKDNNEN